MPFRWWDAALSIFEMLGLVAVLFAVIHSRFVSRWPSVVTTVTLELANDLTLTWFLHHPKGWWDQDIHRYTAYFVIYWGTAAVQSLLRLWIIADVVRSFEGLDFLPPWVYQVIFAVGGSMAVTAAAFCFYSNPHAQPHGWSGLAPFAVLIDRTVNIGCLCLLCGSLLCTKLLGFGWNAVGAYVTNGMLIKVGSKALVAEMLAMKIKHIGNYGAAFDSTCNLVVLLFWVWVFERSHAKGGSSIHDDSPQVISQIANDKQRTVFL